MASARLKRALRAILILLMWCVLFLLTDTLCLLQALAGLPCPGCGSTRAAVALFTGRFAEAFAMHPLILISLAILPYAIYRETLSRGIPEHASEKYIAMGVVSLYIVVYVVRMILLFPHTEPMVPYSRAIWPSAFRWLYNLIT